MELGTNTKMGMNVHLAGWSEDTTMEVDILMPLLAAAGVKIIRSDFVMSILESVEGVFNWTFKDYVVAKAAEYGIQVLALMEQYSVPSWALSNTVGSNVADPIIYGAWCQAVAEHYGDQITYYEIGNEPDLVQFWEPTVDPIGYTELLQSGYAGIKAGNPNAFVISGGLSGFTTASGHYGSDAFLSAMYANGAKGYFDGFGLHLYNAIHGLPPSFAMVDSCNAVMATNGDGSKLVYITEIGWYCGTSSGSVSEATQALYLQELYANIISGSYQSIPFICWYDFVDDGTDVTNSEDNYGLIHNGSYYYPLAPKQAYYAYKTIAGMKNVLPTFFTDYSPDLYLYFDNFIRANGMLGNLTTGQLWNSSTFTIVSNSATNTPTLGSNLVTNGTFSTDTSSWNAVNASLASVTGGDPANCLQVTNVGSNQGYAYQEMSTVVGQWYYVNINFMNGTSIPLVRGGISPGDNSYFQGTGGSWSANWSGLAFYFLATSTTFYLSIGTDSLINNQNTFFDNVSMQQITLTSLMATVSTGFGDVDVSVYNNRVQYSPNGVVLNIDSISNPQNFVLGLENGYANELYLIKCVAGVYTVVESVSVTSINGSRIEVKKTGNSYQLYYNGVATGSVQTISDAGIVSNTIHGMFLPDSQASFNNFILNA